MLTGRSRDAHSEIGFLASALVLATFSMKDMVNLRIVAICSNVAFIAYALVLNLTPILVLHVILLPLNGWRLAQALQAGRLVQHSPTRAWPWSRPLSRIAKSVAPTMRSIILMAMVYMSLAGASQRHPRISIFRLRRGLIVFPRPMALLAAQ